MWTGPSSTQDIQRDFDNMFGRPCNLTGDAFFCASPSDVWQWCESVLAARKYHPLTAFRDGAMSLDELLPMLLPVGALARKKQYDDIRAEKESLDGSFLCDLDHNEGYGPQAGALFPSMDTHPHVYSYKCKRLALPMEYFAAQGLDTYEELSGKRGLTPLLPILQALSDKDSRFLAGNAIHMPSYVCWMLYVLSHCRRRSDLTPMCAALPQAAKRSQDEADPEAQAQALSVPSRRVRRKCQI